MSDRQERVRRILLDELAAARNAEANFSGRVGFSEHISLTGRVIDVLDDLRDAGFGDADLAKVLTPVECATPA